jgi:hypothetical protein
LDDADYRGEQYKNWHCDVKGNKNLLAITQPYIMKNIHRQYSSSIFVVNIRRQYFAHPEPLFFAVAKIQQDQLKGYAGEFCAKDF